MVDSLKESSLNNKNVFTFDETAELLNIDRKELYKWYKSGLIYSHFNGVFKKDFVPNNEPMFSLKNIYEFLNTKYQKIKNIVKVKGLFQRSVVHIYFPDKGICFCIAR